jgi:hypothetical protein
LYFALVVDESVFSDYTAISVLYGGAWGVEYVIRQREERIVRLSEDG